MNPWLLGLIAAVHIPVFLPPRQPFSKFLFSDRSVCAAILSYAEALQLSGTLQSPYRTRSGWLWDYLRSRPRGVGYLSLVWTYQLFGMRANAFHAVDLGIHLANVTLAYGVSNNYTGHAVWIALLWGLHPVAVYTPLFVSARFGLLCAFFMLASVYLLQEGFLLQAAVAGMLAFRTKEDAVVLPLWWGLVWWML